MDTSSLLQAYYKTVLDPFFPKAGVTSAYMGMFNNSNDSISGIRIVPEKTYAFFKESNFFINKDTEIVHFTSLQNAISIVKGLKIRLYNINSLGDPNEVKHISDIISLLQKDQDFNFKNIKENFFIFCGSDYASIKSDKSAEFNMWRLYGNSGEGIGLVFKYDDDPTKIYECFLSKVYYGNNSIFQKCYENHRKFITDNGCPIGGLDDVLVPISLFYKDSIYNVENEIRILKRWSVSQNQNNVLGYDFKNGRNVSYYELPFNSKRLGADPNLQLSKIIIGYKFNTKEKEEIVQMFNKINSSNGQNISINQTSLKDDYFSECKLPLQ